MQSQPPQRPSPPPVYAQVGERVVVGTYVTSTTTTKVSPLIQFDQNYPRTISGALKIACMILSLVGYICAQASGLHYRYGGMISFYSVVSMIAFWITFVLFALYVFHVVEQSPSVPWLYIEFIYCLGMSVFFLFAAFVVVFSRGALSAAGFFGFWATVVYAIDAYLKYEAHGRGDLPQGERTSTNGVGSSGARVAPAPYQPPPPNPPPRGQHPPAMGFNV